MGFLKFIGRFLAFILCIILVVLDLVFLLRTGILYTVEKKNLNNSLNKTDFVELLNTADPKILEDIYGDLGENDISKETIDTCLNAKPLKALISDFVSGTFNSIIRGDDYKLEDATIKVAVRDTLAEVNKEKEIIPVTDEVINDLTKGISDSLKEMPPKEELLEEIDPTVVNIIQTGFGKTGTLIYIGAVVGIILLMALFLFSLYKWLTRTGIASIISGTAVATLGFLTTMIIEVLTKNVEPVIIEIIKIFSNNFSTGMIKAGVILLIAGIIQVVISRIIYKKIHREYQEEVVLDKPSSILDVQEKSS